MHPILRKLDAIYDLRSALIGAALMGTIVALINLSHGIGPALVAAAKQGAYTLFIAGLVLRLCERVSLATRERAEGIALATLVPTIVTIGMTSILHHLRGTPEPWASVIPTALMGPPSFFMWAKRARRLEDEASEQAEKAQPDPQLDLEGDSA